MSHSLLDPSARSSDGLFNKDRPKSAQPQGLWERLKSKCRFLCDSWRFCVLTTVLTVYALFGDDFRLAATHQAADNLFNVLTILCILVFATEILAASIGQYEYFLGFFFVLDFGATITLFFDLTWVWNKLACNNMGSDDSGSGALRTSRAGRAGARAARTVRIIRLIRLVKLYKTYRTAMETRDSTKKKKTAQEDRDDGSIPGETDEDDDLLKEEQDEGKDENKESGARSQKGNKAETRVGKKLSDMTIRRVILLVLVMLFTMPLFPLFLSEAQGIEDFADSASLGSELIYSRFRDWCLKPNASDPTGTPWCLQDLGTPENDLKEERHEERALYEDYLLSYIYTHHAGSFAWNLYWIGFNSGTLNKREEEEEISDVATYLGELARLKQPAYLGDAAPDTTESWDRRYVDPDWETSMVELSEEVRTKLTKPWLEQCHSYYGVAVTSADGDHPTVCSITEELRCSELQTYTPLTKTIAEETHITMMFVFDSRGTTQLEACLSILQTIFIVFVVGLGAMSFQYDANRLLLNPIERMIGKMETIKDNPLEAMKLGDIEYAREDRQRQLLAEKMAKRPRCLKVLYRVYGDLNKAKEPMETVILEKTIIKLGGLLALGFGEAGAEIIGQNMRGGHSAGVNAMVPGSKVDAIIGFCAIRHFTHATEVLTQRLMVFVNQIAEIVHGCVDEFHGAPNKNIGDCFLLVWRLSGVKPEKQTKLADMAIMSFVQIVSEINKSPVLAQYREHPGMLQRVKKYRVTLGFGIHCGWAIEGAIGSEFKIDASYLSPNVNVASRLEAASEQFGMWLLISHFMINLCSQQMARYCRLIDHVTVKGSKQPVRLYTIDLDFRCLQVEKPWSGKTTRNRYKIRQIREVYKSTKWGDDYKVCEHFNNDDSLKKMRALYSADFFLRFSMAYRNYEAGEWKVARDMLLTCHYSPMSSPDGPFPCDEDEWPIDGPTNTLLSFMRQSHYIPPNDWPGHRELAYK